MKPIIIPILLTCSILNAQENSEIAEHNKIQQLIGSKATVAEVLEQNPNAGLSTDEKMTAHWMDFDNDGDYDLITVSVNENRSVCVFLNQNDEYSLVAQTNAREMSLPEISILAGLDVNAEIAWYDKNADGYKDFYLKINGTPYHAEYQSNGDGSFQKLTEDLAVNR